MASFDPPAQIVVPWYHAVLVSRGTTVTPGKYSFLTVSNISTALCAQLGIAPVAGAALTFRFLEASVWLYPSTIADLAKVNLGVVFYATVNAQKGTGARTVKEDVGTPVRPAHCHFRWPLVDRETILTMAAQGAWYPIAVDSAAEGLSLLFQVSLLWRSDGGDIVGFNNLASRVPIQSPCGAAIDW